MPNREPGGPAAEPRMRDLADAADDAITLGGDEVETTTASEPNGWFAGPHADPDRFELLGPGLAGGEGNTWRGRYRGELTQPLTLAVKELRRPPHAPPEWPTPADLRRWTDQRALLQYMRIDHLVTVIDIFVGPPPHLPGSAGGASANTPYVVMEWVPGPTLAEELSGVPATPDTLDQRLAHVQHVAEALHSLHSQTASAGNPTLHRDVKPTNCILDPRRGIVLVDVGTMRRMDDGYDHDGFHTPAYTAPEVLANPHEPRAASSDLYALGALAYFCVVGEDPPVSDQPEAQEQIQARLLAAARSAQVPDPSRFVEHLCLMLDPSPPTRPSDSMSWARRLRSLAAAPSPAAAAPRSPLIWVAAACLVAVVVAGGGYVIAGNGESKGRPSGKPGPSSGSAPGAALPGGPQGGGGPEGGGPPGGGGPPPTGSLPSAATGPDGTVRTSFVSITTPHLNRPAPLCTIVRGTSKLPAGQTLLTAVVNLEMGDEVRHLQLVPGWKHPSTLDHWQGRQFIGLPHEPVGGRFRIEVIMASLAGMKKQIAAAGGENGMWRSKYPPGSRVVASTIVTRAAGGPGPDECGRP
jgi:serine/threonine protein kinase